MEQQGCQINGTPRPTFLDFSGCEPPTDPTLSTTLPSAPRRYPLRGDPFGRTLPAETTAGQQLPINNRFIELSSRRIVPRSPRFATYRASS